MSMLLLSAIKNKGAKFGHICFAIHIYRVRFRNACSNPEPVSGLTF